MHIYDEWGNGLHKSSSSQISRGMKWQYSKRAVVQMNTYTVRKMSWKQYSWKDLVVTVSSKLSVQYKKGLYIVGMHKLYYLVTKQGINSPF